MAMLCLNFCVFAQNDDRVEPLTKGIKIGEQVPNVSLTSLHNYKDKSGKFVSSAQLSDFKGKLLILDFWATWCVPCLEMMPVMDSLQTIFGDQIQFLSVAYQTDQEVLPVLEKMDKQSPKKSVIPVLTNSTTLKKLFPHNVLPHYVWITPDGKFAAISDLDKITRENITEVLEGKSLNWRQREYVERSVYDNQSPLFIGNNGGQPEKLLYYSMLSGYTKGLNSGLSYFGSAYDKGQKITARNLSLRLLYRLAYSDYKTYFGDNRFVFNVKDQSKITSNAHGIEFVDWMKQGNAFCYELIVPPSLKDSAFSIMRGDLARSFSQYKVEIKKQSVPCWVLTVVGDPKLFQSKGGTPDIKMSQTGAQLKNIPLEKLMLALDRFYLQYSLFPIVDGTNFAGTVDLELNCKMSSIQEINKALSSYGLQFIKQDRMVEVMVFSDAMANTFKNGG